MLKWIVLASDSEVIKSDSTKKEGSKSSDAHRSATVFVQEWEAEVVSHTKFHSAELGKILCSALCHL